MIRPIETRDVAEVAQIYNYYIQNTVVSFEEELLEPEAKQSRITKVIDSGFPWLVAEDKGSVVGYCYAFSWNSRSAYQHTAEITVYLKHNETGKGWGSKLYEALFAALGEKGIRTVIGGIALPNSASIALHEKLGMVKVAHFRNIGYKFEQWHDVAYWQGELTP